MKKLFRKSQGHIWWVIILAVLAIIVLILLLALFTGKITFFGKEMESCPARGGQCLPLNQCLQVNLGQLNCPPNQICCLALLNSS